MSDYKTLKAQIAELEKQAEEARKKEIKEALQKIQDIMREYGLEPKDLGFSAAKLSGKDQSKPVAAPKYRDPASAKTWTGRGKPPLWIADAIQAGKQDDYLIDKAATGSNPANGGKSAAKSGGKTPTRKTTK